MGGSGIRFGGATPKQFAPLGCKAIYLHALETFLVSGLLDEIVLVCHPAWVAKVDASSPILRVAKGGATRQESSLAGIRAFSERPQIVTIHDAVRPFVTKTIIVENLDAAILHGAADTCIPTADTLVFSPDGEKIGSIPKREQFLRGQTPQTFRYDLIVTAHEQALRSGVRNASDDCRLVLDLGNQVAIVRGCEENLKITSEFDLRVAEGLLSIAEEKIEKRPSQSNAR